MGTSFLISKPLFERFRHAGVIEAFPKTIKGVHRFKSFVFELSITPTPIFRNAYSIEVVAYVFIQLLTTTVS